MAVYQSMLADTDVIAPLVASIERQVDETQTRFDVGDAGRPELLAVRLQLVLAKLAQLDVQERLQQAVGSIENAIQQPAEAIFPELTRNASAEDRR